MTSHHIALGVPRVAISKRAVRCHVGKGLNVFAKPPEYVALILHCRCKRPEVSLLSSILRKLTPNLVCLEEEYIDQTLDPRLVWRRTADRWEPEGVSRTEAAPTLSVTGASNASDSVLFRCS